MPALLAPATYGAAPEDAVYTADGMYTLASGEARPARLYFRDGVLRQVFGFTGSDAAAAPREITPQSGDRFTVLERWYDLDTQGRVIGQAAEEAGTLIFRDQMFTWQEPDAAPGNYVVGFIAEDLDGNKQQVYAQVTVHEGPRALAHRVLLTGQQPSPTIAGDPVRFRLPRLGAGHMFNVKHHPCPTTPTTPPTTRPSATMRIPPTVPTLGGTGSRL